MNWKQIITGAAAWIAAAPFCWAQPARWQPVDSLFGPLPEGVEVYYSESPVEGKPNVAYYISIPLRDRRLRFTTDTTKNRRLTPTGFYEKNGQPLVVVNGTFFEFTTHRNLNAVVKNGRLVSYNPHSFALRGKDTLLYAHPFRSAIGLTRRRNPDVAWLFTDSSKKFPFALQVPVGDLKDSLQDFRLADARTVTSVITAKGNRSLLRPWRMHTAIGGGPVLVQNGRVFITNDEERMFSGRAIDDRHPRTAMGFTADGRLIILVVQGRTPGEAEGVSLRHLAELLTGVGCIEALNLDGGGSSSLLINGKETIRPSDREGQRPVPGVFIIQQKRNKFAAR
ncbi:MAG TPA: phosphodiester glycosidase family protein [Lacibacter sp.]|nr:phosphodiester glycosidase family protein [Lacibacter sp.]HMO89744.1 phosphodiester glycosidase family protein [Lacibacter sp.]HMP87242.1 phosphodiester glycosidase family protein [Lacibacter sp.]